MSSRRSLHLALALAPYLVLALALSACSASDENERDAGGSDAVDAVDAVSDALDDWTYVEAAPRPVELSCAPLETAFDNEDCASASILIDGAKTPSGCEPHPGARRSLQPVITFERQDDTCAGWTVIEVLYYAKTNSAARFTSASHGFIPEDDDQVIRELPQGMLLSIGLETTEQPARRYEINVKLLVDKLVVSKVTSLQ